MDRKPIPVDIETAVLLKSARRCTLCFHLKGDLEEKIGQLAHLDKDPSNSAEGNLAFLCLTHHSLFDSRTSQHKNFTIQEVKAARADLYEAIAQKRHLGGRPSAITSNWEIRYPGCLVDISVLRPGDQRPSRFAIAEDITLVNRSSRQVSLRSIFLIQYGDTQLAADPINLPLGEWTQLLTAFGIRQKSQLLFPLNLAGYCSAEGHIAFPVSSDGAGKGISGDISERRRYTFEFEELLTKEKRTVSASAVYALDKNNHQRCSPTDFALPGPKEAALEQSLVADELQWTDKLISAKQVRGVLSNCDTWGQRYYRVIEMSAKGYEKTPNDLQRALRKSVVWHAERQPPWPSSIGSAEYMPATPSKINGPLTAREPHSDGVTYSFTKDDHFEYVEARRHDCSVTIVETESAFSKGKLSADEEIGTISNALRFWTEFYTNLSMAGNYADFKITWYGLYGVRLVVGDKQFEGMLQEILLPSHTCDHSSPVESERLAAHPVNAAVVTWHFDFLKRLSGHLFSQFNFFDPPESVIQAVLRKYYPDAVPPVGMPPSFDERTAQNVQRVGNAAMASDSTVDSHLSAKEQELLGNAVKDPSGQITHIKAIGHDKLSVNGRQFPHNSNARSAAEWFGALRSLENKKLLEAVGPQRDFFRVTDTGYALSDRLGEFVRWHTEQVTLEAHYFNAPADTVTLSCRGIVRLAAEYYPDRVGADGIIARSLKNRCSLLVEGVDARAVDALSWNPTEISFVDQETAKVERFRVEGRVIRDGQALRLAILGQ